MKPIDFPEVNNRLGAPGFTTLPVYEADTANGYVVASCWKLSWREAFRILWTRKLWHGQITQGAHPQPIHQSVKKGEVIIKQTK